MKIAIVGSGISGLGASWLLNQKYDITLFEQDSRLGGHANTSTINYPNCKNPINVDTGFIVYNFRTYHHLKPFFEHLQVKIEKSDMSFGVSDGKGFEYSGKNFFGLFANRKNIFDWQFYRMLFDIMRFNFLATKIAKSGNLPESSLQEFLDEIGVGEYFKNFYLYPMTAAIWSCPIALMKRYPTKSFLDFFHSHGLLTVFNQPQWYTVSQGSKEYVKKLTSSFAKKIKQNCAITSAYQEGEKIILLNSKNQKYEFDHVVFACHANQTLQILQDANDSEKEILSKFEYSQNVAVLHRDVSQMPKNKGTWASWVVNPNDENKVSLNYWMNNLQNIDEQFPLFVTLNPYKKINEEMIFEQHHYAHPIFNQKAQQAQENIDQIQGKRNIWFCGAYLGYGFHEDGLLSAIRVANKLGVKAPWQ